MEDIREENPQKIFEMWMFDRRRMQEEIARLNGIIATKDTAINSLHRELEADKIDGWNVR
jgi:hypothetical protein